MPTRRQEQTAGDTTDDNYDMMSRWKPYPEYKYSDIECLGKVPQHWKNIRLKFLVRKITDGEHISPLLVNEGIPLLSAKDIRSRTILYDVKKYVTHEQAKQFWKRCQPQRGDILIVSRGATIGRVGLVEKETSFCLMGSVILCKSKQDESSEFLYYAMNSHKAQTSMWLTSASSAQQAIYIQDVAELQIPFPPLPEQHAIAAFLDTHTARIDTLIAKKERHIALLKEKRAALISHAVTKGLDPDAEMKDSGMGSLGKVPVGWDVVRIKRAAKMDSGHTPDKKITEYWKDCNIPWVSLRDTNRLRESDYIHDTEYCINELGLANSSAHILPKGTVVFTRDATIGLCAILSRPMAVSQHIIAWICGQKLLPKYLLFVFYSMEQELNRLTMGSTIKTIGMPEVNELTTPLPSLPEQQTIATYLDHETARIDALIEKVDTSTSMLREYRTALISAAVTGKIDVREEVVA